MTGKDLKWCKGCAHLSRTSGIPVCNYAYDTGCCRSTICPPGFGCVCHTKFDKAEERRREQRTVFLAPEQFETTRGDYRRIDKAAARAMYDAGANDREIADRFGCTPGAVRNWRRVYGLETKHARGSPKRRKDDGYGTGSPGAAV